MLAEGANAFIVLPGGLGTLEEAAEVANERSYKIHLKPLILLNHNNFWSPFIEQMQLMKRLGFIERPTPPFEVCATIDEMFSTLEQKLQEANKITKLGVK
jgi:predicted Rossmann-fold nucleotide-binding protein